MAAFYDKNGKPVETIEWAKLRGDQEYCRIGLTKLPGNRHVSTVWMGMDFNPLYLGVPHIFETAFLQDGHFVEVYGRCATLEEAKEMHQRAVELYGNQRL